MVFSDGTPVSSLSMVCPGACRRGADSVVKTFLHITATNGSINFVLWRLILCAVAFLQQACSNSVRGQKKARNQCSAPAVDSPTRVVRPSSRTEVQGVIVRLLQVLPVKGAHNSSLVGRQPCHIDIGSRSM